MRKPIVTSKLLTYLFTASIYEFFYVLRFMSIIYYFSILGGTPSYCFCQWVPPFHLSREKCEICASFEWFTVFAKVFLYCLSKDFWWQTKHQIWTSIWIRFVCLLCFSLDLHPIPDLMAILHTESFDWFLSGL